MAQKTVEQILKSAKKAEGDRDLNRAMFEDCYEYLLPFRNTFTNQSGSHNKPTKQYDSTGMISAGNFVNTMQGNFTPVFQRWAELKAGAGVAEEARTEFNKQLADINKLFFTYLNSSNFSTASSEMYFDWGIGTGALWFFEGDETQPFNFLATPISHYGLEDGRFGEVAGIYKTTKIKKKLIKPTWGKFGITLPEGMKLDEDEDKEVEILEALYKDYSDFVWRYEIIAVEQKHRMAAQTHKESICFTPRWLKIPGFAYGIGPFIMAMADVKTLNKLKELMLQHAALSVFGVYTVANNGSFNPNTAKIKPHAFIPVERNAGPNGPTIAAMPRAGDFQAQEFMITKLEEQIRQVMLDTKLPTDRPQPRSAFEIAERVKEFQIDIGAAYGRGMFEYIQPMYRRGVQILNDKGMLNLPENFDIDNFLVKVQVVSPIAQTQAAADLERFTQNYQIVSSISPELALTAYDIEKLPEWMTENTGAPAELLRSETDKEQLNQTIASMLAAQQAAGQERQPTQQGAPNNV